MNYLQSAKRQFELYKHLGDKAMAQLGDEALLWQSDPEMNSIAQIVKHLWGNMLSRWTDFLTTDGEKPWRRRDEEFEPEDLNRATIMERWEAGWACLFNALDSITDDDLERIIFIRNDGHTVLEAVNRQIAHYSYHVGQMVFIAKMIRKADWQTLSIARNKSKDYNAGKFAQGKERRSFTDDLIR
jgi:hypothetical protein